MMDKEAIVRKGERRALEKGERQEKNSIFCHCYIEGGEGREPRLGLYHKVVN